jgi:predicted kinase
MGKIPGNKLLIICGLSFAGKSTLGKAITERFGYEEVDVDVTKFKLFGQRIKDEELHPDDWIRVYAETDKLIEDMLKSGKAVVDASRNFSRTERKITRSIADKVGVPIITIYIDTPEEIVRQRLFENRRTYLRRDVTDNDFEDVIRSMEPPAADENPLIFHYRDEIHSWLSKNSAKLDVLKASL